jgi:hypothetical protein
MTLNFLNEFQSPVASDLTIIAGGIRQTLGNHLAFALPVIESAIVGEGLIASSVMMLCARAIGLQDGDEQRLHAFATAMELMVISLGAHAQLDRTGLSEPANPLLTLGTAASVLLGDALYTRAFQLVVRTGHTEGLAEIGRATEDMVVAATGGRVMADHLKAPLTTDSSYRAAAYASSCRLASLLQDSATLDQHMLVSRLADRLAKPEKIASTIPADFVTRDTDKLFTCFDPSIFRDALVSLYTSPSL